MDSPDRPIPPPQYAPPKDIPRPLEHATSRTVEEVRGKIDSLARYGSAEHGKQGNGGLHTEREATFKILGGDANVVSWTLEGTEDAKPIFVQVMFHEFGRTEKGKPFVVQTSAFANEASDDIVPAQVAIAKIKSFKDEERELKEGIGVSDDFSQTDIEGSQVLSDRLDELGGKIMWSPGGTRKGSGGYVEGSASEEFLQGILTKLGKINPEADLTTRQIMTVDL